VEGTAEPLPRPGWLISERSRSLISIGVSAALYFVAVTVLTFYLPDLGRSSSVLGLIVAWALFTTVHTVLTWLAFRGLHGDRLRRAVRALAGRGRRRSSLGRVLDRLLRDDAPSWSVQISVIALISVGALIVAPGLRQQPLVVGIGLAMVAASWVNMSMVYAVHYARIDLESGGLAFPGEAVPSFIRYRYLALSIQTTFGTTDVELHTDVMRRIAMSHGLLAFVFNSVIIALIVSLVLGVS
jgi:uncharacterized membrane protein